MRPESRDWGLGIGDSAPPANRQTVRLRDPGRYALRACLLLLLVCLGQLAQASQDPAPSQSPIPNLQSPPEISLLTIGPGPVYFERFGHNAIVVRGGGETLAYNYGMFDFEEEDFFLNFIRGRMRYRIAVSELADDLAWYRQEGRSIVEQPLELAPAEALELAGFLAWNARPENAWYRYDYFTDNCSTRVRDALDRALGGLLRQESHGRSRGFTYRLDALRLMAPQPALMLAIDLGLGPFADQRIDYWQESFVPMTLQQVVGTLRRGDDDVAGRPLASATIERAAGSVEEPPVLPPDLRVPFLLLGAAAGALIAWLGRFRRAAVRVPLASFAVLFQLACGLGGLVLLLLWFGTEHRAAWRNENLLLLDPLCLALVPAWLGVARGRRRARPLAVALSSFVVLVAGFALFSKILPWFAQANLHWILLLLPIHLALGLTLARASTPARITPSTA